MTGESEAVARVGDLPGIVPTLRGKVEFEASEEGREIEVLRHLLRRAVAETFRLRLAGTDLSGLVARFEEGETVETGDLVPAEELLRRVGPVEGLGRIVTRLGDEDAESPGSQRPRWSSRWRGCTSCAASPRTRSAAARCTAEADEQRCPVRAVRRRARPAGRAVRRRRGAGRGSATT